MDETLRQLARRGDVSPDDEVLEIRRILAAGRGDPSFIPSLYQRLAHALYVEYQRRPLDVVVEIDPDTPLSMIEVIVSGRAYEPVSLVSGIVFDITADGRRARVCGRGWSLIESDVVEVICYGPLGRSRRNYEVYDPRIHRVLGLGLPSAARRFCNDCDEEIDQHGDCLCSIGLCPMCPTCGGSGINDWTIHNSVPDPCFDCGGGCTLADYERTTNSRLRD